MNLSKLLWYHNRVYLIDTMIFRSPPNVKRFFLGGGIEVVLVPSTKELSPITLIYHDGSIFFI